MRQRQRQHQQSMEIGPATTSGGQRLTPRNSTRLTKAKEKERMVRRGNLFVGNAMGKTTHPPFALVRTAAHTRARSVEEPDISRKIVFRKPLKKGRMKKARKEHNQKEHKRGGNHGEKEEERKEKRARAKAVSFKAKARTREARMR